MKPKQSEMDGILESIYETFTTNVGERTLMVVCGDHGMNDVCSSKVGTNRIRREIMAALPRERLPQYAPFDFQTYMQAVLFSSPSFPAEGGIECPVEPTGDFHFYTKIQQSDLVPTISTLLGWPIPRNNIGVLLKPFLRLWKGTIPSDPADFRCNRSIGCYGE